MLRFLISCRTRAGLGPIFECNKVILNLFLKHLKHGLKNTNRLINNSHIRPANHLHFKVFRTEQHKNLKI